MKSHKALISVIICTYNRAEVLKDVLESLLHQKVSNEFDYEIVVVDNNSGDKTFQTIDSYKQYFDGRLRYALEPKQGLSHARNKGIEDSNGEIIAFTDDDVVVDSEWLLNIMKCFKKPNCEAVGGRVLPVYPENVPQWLKKNIDLLGGPMVCYDFGTSTKGYNEVDIAPFVGANMAFRKNCFNKYGLFRVDLGAGTKIWSEDTEFFNRIGKINNIYYCGKALVYHHTQKDRMKFVYLANWYIKAGRYLAHVDNCSQIVRYFNIPRYIYKKFAKNVFSLFLNFFNKRRILKSFIVIFISIGQFIGYRELKND